SSNIARINAGGFRRTLALERFATAPWPNKKTLINWHGIGGSGAAGEDTNFSKAMAELAAMRARGDIEQPDFENARGLLREKYGMGPDLDSSSTQRQRHLSQARANTAPCSWNIARRTVLVATMLATRRAR
ncbi:hypothetical protein, partial [Mesorhizobium intechi]|uniref:hypothetical protein n=1 Tax=Mesorhizobium intechi TaxID=537601 RepID=UPI001ABF1C77